MANALSSIRRSFDHAWRGMCLAFRTERSFRIHVAAALLVTTAMLLLPIGRFERLILLVAMAAVLVLELLNSMVERLVDLFKPRLNDYVGDIKDLMAATVLLASAFAAFIGLMIFWPHLASILPRL